MYNAEEQTATRTLRLAFSLGQEAAAAAALEPPVASAVAAKSCTSTPLLDVGIITAPTHTDRRESLRAAYARLLQGSRCEVSLFFILGNLSDIPKQQRVQISSEHSLSGDILWLPAHDGKTAGVSHGGRAVAEKALSWFIHAAKHTQAPFVMKVDDDTTAHLPRLLLHVERLRTQVPNAPFVYYGKLTYRMWDWSGRHRQGANPSCGERHATDRGAPVHKPQSLTRLLKAKRPGGKCEYASGPFLYPDGSLEIVGRGLLEAVFTSRRVLDFARTNLARIEPPIWSHEDVGIGALVHREVSARGLPITFVACRMWESMRYWINWADTSTLIDRHVLWVHFKWTKYQYVADAFAATAREPPETPETALFGCEPCEEGWGLSPSLYGSANVSCCAPLARPSFVVNGAINRNAAKGWPWNVSIRRGDGIDFPPACGLGASRGLFASADSFGGRGGGSWNWVS